MTAARSRSETEARAFDLNTEDVLDHWPVAHALRELIANALDEHHLTSTAEPVIEKLTDGRWIIQDFGRGLRYEHLTQRENPEKAKHPLVIGQFGMGLKEALAVCERRGIGVEVQSPHGDITTEKRAKAGFSDVTTLHALIGPPTDPAQQGTRVLLSGLSDDDVTEARSVFLRYSGDRLLEGTKYGDVLAKSAATAPGRVYVKGLLIAEEEQFLFSYNITKVTSSLKASLNRERAHVGRTAYSDRIQAILKACKGAEVAGPLADDLGGVVDGSWHDELKSWIDVAVHACRILNSHERVVFVTPRQIDSVTVERAEDDGYRAVIVPENVARRLPKLKDIDGEPILDVDRYRDQYNDSFNFEFVDHADLTTAEQDVLALADQAADLAGFMPKRYGVKAILISETMRLNPDGGQVVGLWDQSEGRVIIRRDQLASPAQFCGTLLHELEHAASGHGDKTLAFEEGLTNRLGIVAAAAVGMSAA